MSEATALSGFEPPAGALRLLSDERLVKRATAGDERAFAAIYGRYYQDLYRFCLAIVGNPHDAADALQSTMVKVMRALPGEERQIQLKPWLYRIAHNESIEVLRRRLPSDPLDPELAGPAPSPAEGAEQRTRLRRLLADLAELPDRQRVTLIMRELAGLDFAEIGNALGTSAAAARQTLYEARLSLRRMEEGRELSCDAITKALSDADGRVIRRRDVRAHLRECQGCRRFRDELRHRRADLAGLAPLPAAAAAGILQGILGSGGGGGAAAGAAGGGLGAAAAGKAVGMSAIGGATLAKGAATVAVIAAIGVGAADRSGLVEAGLSGGSGSTDAPAAVESVPGEGGAEGATGGSLGERDGGEVGSHAVSGPKSNHAPQPGAAQEVAAAATGTAEGTTPEPSPMPVVPGDGAGQKGNSPSAAEQGQANGQDDVAPGHSGGSKGSNSELHGNKGGNAKAGNGNGVGQQSNGNQGNGQGSSGEHPIHPTHPPKPESPPGQAAVGQPVPPNAPTAAGQAPAASSHPHGSPPGLP